MKVPLSAQIAAATRHRDQLETAVQSSPELMPDLHATEATILTLSLIQSTETEFRQFMATKRSNA
jgi:hypothetical protein